MFTVPLVLAMALAPAQSAPVKFALAGLPGQKLRAKEWIPPTPPVAITTAIGIEVTVGPLPTQPGGPPDETVLRSARVGVTSDEILAFFKMRTPPAPDREKIDALIKDLGGDDVARRDKAQQQLVAIGASALPMLRTAVNNIDEAEAATRARQIVTAVDGPNAANLVINAARVLAEKKPAGAADALLSYLPFCEDNASFQECEAALAVVGMSAGKPDPAILKYLKDKNGIRRGTAAQVLCQVGGPAHYATIRPLLKDALPSVRLRVALGLVGAHDGEAVPVLIDLVGELPPSLKPVAEEFLYNLAGEWAVAGPKGHDVTSRKLRRDVWQAWWKNTDGSTLLEEFRSRTPGEEDRIKIDQLIAQLDDKDNEKRAAASPALVAMGKKAASQLRRAAASGHERIAPFAAKALEAIEKDEPNPLPGAAARLLALRKPEGAVEALLGYVAVAESDDAAAQIIDLLASIGVPGGKSDEVLVKALKDKSPVRRAAAAMAITRGRDRAQFATLAKMLDDKDPVVRFRIGEGLAMNADKVGVSAVISSLKDLPSELGYEALDLLGKIAGEKAPAVTLGDTAETRGKASEEWAKWWKENEAGTKLVRMEFGGREGGQNLVVEQWSPTKGSGRVFEIDRGGKPRWEIGSLNYPNYATLLRNGNVLMIEQQSRITERDRKGKVLNQIDWGSSIYVDKMPDGKTFVGCHNGIFIFDKDKKQTFTHYYNINTLAAVRRFKDGSMCYVSYSGHYVRLDKNGKQVKTFNLPWGTFGINGADILPGDRVVVSVSNFNKVIGYGPDAKQAWEVPLNNPMWPTATPAGHVLVPGENQTKMLEIDRRGKIVKEWKGFDYKPLRLVRR